MWLLYLSAFFQNIPFYRFQEAKALFYKLSHGKISVCPELQWTLHLWQPTILRFLQLLSLSFCLISNCPSLCVHARLLQSCPTLCKPMDCSLPRSSVHGILQAQILEWFAISFSRIFPTQGSSPGLPYSR